MSTDHQQPSFQRNDSVAATSTRLDSASFGCQFNRSDFTSFNNSDRALTMQSNENLMSTGTMPRLALYDSKLSNPLCATLSDTSTIGGISTGADSRITGNTATPADGRIAGNTATALDGSRRTDVAAAGDPNSPLAKPDAKALAELNARLLNPDSSLAAIGDLHRMLRNFGPQGGPPDMGPFQNVADGGSEVGSRRRRGGRRGGRGERRHGGDGAQQGGQRRRGGHAQNPQGGETGDPGSGEAPRGSEYREQPGSQRDNNPQLRGNSNAERAFNYFTDRGLTREQAAGIVGNLIQENHNLDPRKPGDGGNSVGIAQWNGPRRRDLMAFANQNNSSPYDLKTQLDFMMHELNGKESRAMRGLQSARTPDQAALVFSRLYERPGNPMNGNRVRHARMAYNNFGQDTYIARNPEQ